MNITINDIRLIFDRVIAGSISREEASRVAQSYRECSDLNELVVIPESERKRAWNAIIFLNGVDLKDAPNSYLHNEEDIRDERP